MCHCLNPASRRHGIISHCGKEDVGPRFFVGFIGHFVGVQILRLGSLPLFHESIPGNSIQGNPREPRAISVGSITTFLRPDCWRKSRGGKAGEGVQLGTVQMSGEWRVNHLKWLPMGSCVPEAGKKSPSEPAGRGWQEKVQKREREKKMNENCNLNGVSS